MTSRLPAASDIQLLYVSQATAPLARHALEALARSCDARNRARGLTGMLLYSAGNFAQVLEGAPATVELLFTRIMVDPRHRDVRRLQAGPIATRAFGDWHMGLLNADDLRPLDRARLTRTMRDFAHVSGRHEHWHGAAMLAAFRELLPRPERGPR